jgi:hypothetical protein
MMIPMRRSRAWACPVPRLAASPSRLSARTLPVLSSLLDASYAWGLPKPKMMARSTKKRIVLSSMKLNALSPNPQAQTSWPNEWGDASVGMRQPAMNPQRWVRGILCAGQAIRGWLTTSTRVPAAGIGHARPGRPRRAARASRLEDK